MRYAVALLAAIVLLCLAIARADGDPEPRGAGNPPALPMGGGLPLIVRVGVAFADVAGVDENEGAFDATVDVRLLWRDATLSYPASEVPNGFRELRTEAAQERLAEIWSPDIVLDNLVGEPTQETAGLRLYPDGRVELMRRVSGRFSTPFDVTRFPFDRQWLAVGVASRREPLDRVFLDFRQGELDFSRASSRIDLDGWDVGMVELRRSALAGWYGQDHARLEAALSIERHPSAVIPSIFVPLFASLLIPLLAIWMNKVEDGEYKIEAFELTNVVIGGLFAVIALNFTVNSEYQALARGDNTVVRLFALNYSALAVSLLVNVFLFRFNLARRWLGPYVQDVLFSFIIWAVPLLSFSTAASFLLVAMA